MDRFGIILLTIIISGAAGGLLNYLLLPADENGRNYRGAAKLALVGAIVSFTVPLFLSMAKSSLIDDLLKVDVLTQNSASTQFNVFGSSLLVLSGFCIVASFASRQFMGSLVNKLIYDVNQAKNVAQSAKDKAKSAEKRAIEAEELVEEAIQSSDKASGRHQVELPPASEVGTPLPELSEIEFKVLMSSTRYTMRTLTGMARDADVTRDRIAQITNGLVAKGVLDFAPSRTTGDRRLRITGLGMRVLNERIPNFEAEYAIHLKGAATSNQGIKGVGSD